METSESNSLKLVHTMLIYFPSTHRYTRTRVIYKRCEQGFSSKESFDCFNKSNKNKRNHRLKNNKMKNSACNCPQCYSMKN